MHVEWLCQAAATIGTTARLRTGDTVSVIDLLHGLMLPSGNDAAVVGGCMHCLQVSLSCDDGWRVLATFGRR